MWWKVERQETDTQIGKGNTVLHDLYCSVITKQEFSNTTKLSILKSVFVLILTYVYESWVMTKKMSTQMQAPKMEFLQEVHGVTKGHIDARLRPGQETSLVPPYLNLSYCGIKCPALMKKLVTLLQLFGTSQYSAPRTLCPLVMPWCHTSRQSAQLWNSKCPECRTTSPNSNWENTTTLVQPCIQNAKRKTREAPIFYWI